MKKYLFLLDGKVRSEYAGFIAWPCLEAAPFEEFDCGGASGSQGFLDKYKSETAIRATLIVARLRNRLRMQRGMFCPTGKLGILLCLSNAGRRAASPKLRFTCCGQGV